MMSMYNTLFMFNTLCTNYIYQISPTVVLVMTLLYISPCNGIDPKFCCACVANEVISFIDRTAASLASLSATINTIAITIFNSGEIVNS